jgi:hypothetical protein
MIFNKIALSRIVPTSTQPSIIGSTGWDIRLHFFCGPKKYWWRECFWFHEIGRINGRRGFRTGWNVFRIGGNIFYDQKNKIPMKILELKWSGIWLIVEFCGIPNGFPNQGGRSERTGNGRRGGDGSSRRGGQLAGWLAAVQCSCYHHHILHGYLGHSSTYLTSYLLTGKSLFKSQAQ